MKKYYYNTKIYLVEKAGSSTGIKTLIILALWLIATIPCWIALIFGSLLGVTPGLVAVIATGIFLFFAGSFQLALWALATVLTIGIALA